MFDVVDTVFSYGIALIVCQFLQEFCKAKESTHVLCVWSKMHIRFYFVYQNSVSGHILEPSISFLMWHLASSRAACPQSIHCWMESHIMGIFRAKLYKVIKLYMKIEKNKKQETQNSYKSFDDFIYVHIHNRNLLFTFVHDGSQFSNIHTKIPCTSIDNLYTTWVPVKYCKILSYKYSCCMYADPLGVHCIGPLLIWSYNYISTSHLFLAISLIAMW